MVVSDKNILFLLAFLLTIWANSESCKHNGRTYKDGEEWRERSVFIRRCTIFPADGSWRTEVIACVLPDGKTISINQQPIIAQDGYGWKCELNKEGNIQLMRTTNPGASCDGKVVGSKFQEGSFELECLPGGIKRLVSCVADGSHKIPVNQTAVLTRGGQPFILKCSQFANGTAILKGIVKLPKLH